MAERETATPVGGEPRCREGAHQPALETNQQTRTTRPTPRDAAATTTGSGRDRLAPVEDASKTTKMTAPHLPLRARVGRWLYDASLDVGMRLMDQVSEGIRRLPPQVRYLPVDVLTTLIGTFWPRRALIERNFALMLGVPVTDRRVRHLTVESVRNYGRMSIDFLTVRTMPPHEVLRWGKEAGEDHFNNARSDGRGIIFALPHFGGWDVGAAYAQAYGLKLTVVTESNWVTELVAGSRREQGVTLAPRDKPQSLRLLFRALQRQECVVMLADLANEGVETMDVSFFGRPAPFPMGPARLAQRTGAPIVVVTSVPQPDLTYRVEALAPIRPDRTCPADEEVARLTQAIVHRFEEVIRANPAQWYPFHDVWPGLRAPRTYPHAREP